MKKPLVFFFWVMSASAKEVTLAWDELNFATQYELEITSADKVILSEKINGLKWEGTLEEGTYQYKVRAFSKTKRIGTWSATQSFEILAPAPEAPEVIAKEEGAIPSQNGNSHSQLKASLLGAQYNYTSRIQDTGSGRINDGKMMGAAINGDWFLASQFAVAAEVDYRSLQVEKTSTSTIRAYLGAKYSLFQKSSKFFLIPSLGIEHIDFPEFSKASNNSPFEKRGYGSIRSAVGADLGYYFSSHWSLGLDAHYAHSLFDKDKVSSGLRLAPYLQYFITKSWVTGAGVQIESDDLSYVRSGNQKKGEISMESHSVLLFTRILIGN